MYQYHCLNAISNAGLEVFDEDYTKVDNMEDADAVLVRSAAMHDMEFGKNLKVIARAGAGVNNIPLTKCADHGIVVFNTPGANANAVKELVIAGMFMASRDIVGGVNWVQSERMNEDIAKLTEKEKKRFAGNELQGKKLGVIGLGAIGVQVANTAVHLGMEVYGYDPYISVKAAWSLSRHINHIKNVEDIYKQCDFITVHVPLLDSTKKMINKEAIDMMKDGVVVMNFARDLLVDEKAMIAALADGKVKHYVTDFPNTTVAGVKGAIVTPHLGASTEEAEDNCAAMAAKEIRNFLENGNIVNSVNYPNCDMGIAGEFPRLSICHKNIKNMLNQFTDIMTDEDINIEHMTNASRGDYAYTMFDLSKEPSEGALENLAKIEGVLRVRVIRK
ncbi:MAG: phosphoglycerate dehydrogenase [Lachnospiraceae bacterium]|nr:phosphoglycerate dehydrogenase [Lachnospiraceae bacterium]